MLSELTKRQPNVVCEHVQSKPLFVALVALVALSGLWFVLSDGEPSKGSALAQREHAPSSHAEALAARNDDPKTDSRPNIDVLPQQHKVERKAMRQRIIAGLIARENAAKRSPKGDSKPPAKASERPPARAAEQAPVVGNLKDRSGNHSYLLKVMNEELMPLADECYALALEQNPTLKGDLMLNIETIGDEEIGGVVEVVEPGPDNQIVDPLLLECMRESIFATTLPAPDESGRDAFMLSMPLHPE